MVDATTHYDLLIEENNDPFRDSAALQRYMDRWDGPVFLQALRLTKDQDVLEIGIGTGRVAAKTAPLCRSLTGIDLSAKTIGRAKENLKDFSNIHYVLGDFLDYSFAQSFQVIYSTLTFLHIAEKKRAVDKIAHLLTDGGRVVVSLDKNQEQILDFGTRRIRVYPDTPGLICTLFQAAGVTVVQRLETEFAHIVVGRKAGP